MQTSSRISAVLRVSRGAFGNSLRRSQFSIAMGSSLSQMGMATSTSATARTLPFVTRSRSGLCNSPCFIQGFGNGQIVPLSESHMTVLQAVRQPFSSSRKCLCEKTTKDVAKTQRLASEDERITRVASSEHHQHFSARNASDFDKRLLVYFGKYKSIGEVPNLVSVHLLNSTRNKFRIYVNLFIGFLTAASCVFMIYRGHSRAGQGETLAHHNMMRHPEHYQKQLKG